MSTNLIILAAGKGTRMHSDMPKVLHKVAGAPLLIHAMKAGAALDPAHTVIVAGHGFDAVSAAAIDFDEDAQVVLQAEQNGTGHAVLCAQEALAGATGDALVLYGDTPFISQQTLEAMNAARAEFDVVVLGFEAADAGRYGRLVMEGENLERIVEFKDASDEERSITFCNSGVILSSNKHMFGLLEQVTNDNASGEYYLTDIIGLARKAGLSATAVACDEAETMGVNSRADLAAAEAAFQSRARIEALESGVTLTAPETVFFAHDTYIGADTIIEPNVVFGPEVTVENGAHIRAFTHIEGAHVSRGAIVGPYARLRPGAELSENVHVGNFVEIKNATLAEGAKANHLTYIGDASIGADTNIGAGTITCNYDGVFKHHTEIGARAFIGSNTMLIAPVTVGNEAMTATAAVINTDVPDGALAISRTPQVNKPNLAVKLFDKLRAKKKKQQEESK
ncbi:bifunctional UDP-N-acetylglucosamine diphosphorylase/glucosamine-1-phosphate N-acetyltransferase GlmU [Lentibacter algarum]|uniref:bifunctional UDP-N-acetylglucosamine diphosphorylase/glucosamine-1-phosphate N-acetyltransferase GlmU n=1 Tax=Lentibacter algarum TaxID=576131 RepID=UPI001C073698|nr:bifunctional UDP-N-acetylglucosamine diphosphorylase/glucosamine-1-phosphate N-acetyltransferase GlmU [Lentibacter algarum]MBU2982055.1 bifunctional UDP-N-acetylglucosamine diphosphorylase/glucosamine-1-phosphate N-acetyltransferase GlmU [Lentibacter algarum]